MSDAAERAEKTERRWAVLAVGLAAAMTVLAAAAGLHQAVMPQAQLETIDPRTLHVAGEFVESNLGSAVEPDGSVTVRVLAQQYSFTPQCILVPADTPLSFRTTSSDVVHGFLVFGTNLNQMVVPGYISAFKARFAVAGEHVMPCHEFCGVGHEGMWAKIRVVPKEQFLAQSKEHGRQDCAN